MEGRREAWDVDGLDPLAPLGPDAHVASRADDARGRAALARVFEAALQVWAARQRWALSQTPANAQELERAEERCWRLIEASLQVRPTR